MTFLEKLLRSKAFVITLIVLPGLWPAWPFLQQDPSVLADFPKYLLHHLGFVACVLLATVLTFTPLRVLFPKSRFALALNRHRRLVGVSAFVYAALHVTMHFIYEGGFGTFTFSKDLAKPFILSGVVAFTILLLLAITSLDRAVRLLGGKRWKALHRLVYLAAALVAYHQAAARKIFPMQVLWIFVPLAALELLRIWKRRETAKTV
jgi:sulfoxide reductase heme-binding subunit YedZ